MKKDILSDLVNIVGDENVAENEPMSKHTSFKIGGNADFFMTPRTVEQIKAIITYCVQNTIAYFVIGNGSNLLVSDDGYRGVIIQLYDKFNEIKYANNGQKVIVKAQAGVMLGRLGNELMKKSITGFEFATGIPGTIGGAVMMNAGAYDGEIKNVIINACLMDAYGNIVKLNNSQLELGYRTSIIAKEKYIVLEAEFELEKGNQEEIKNKLNDFTVRRKEKQPLELPSAGSIFKRPQGYYAGKLISDANLVGYTVGGAQVSKKHAGFVVNIGNATAKDIINLTDDVKNKVKEQFGVELELEVKKLGFDK
ncbi:UDP-N-acetylmuramate dehydrogenase [[Clostridium] fimetarium]|uniref:UDP-N-acetylenolpyruvoylglucosamine reductase n=1 Tax=[Clostridium] fimetarium TaxID=99656 RepID=A0A1I0M954_9FIRM|nr:UDP-N-acetylmuramate dehydrogenase [[Clostridium] fimetarium]SEV84290.1 UDP-N-acetylmuramate dehydrogenase [[Clostridium] fimetarium]